MEIQPLKIGTKMAKVPVIQGGMGVGISLGNLAGAVAKEGGIGIISAAQPGFKEKDFEKNPLEANLRAVKSEYEKARKLAPDGIIGFNLMVAMEHYEEYVHAVVEAGADLIVSGAGLPTELPKYVGDSDILLAPIVSTAKSANVILKYWDKKYQRIPDLVVIEGPLAGGHLGFREDQLDEYEGQAIYDQEIQKIKEIIQNYSDKYEKKIPIAIGGGIHDSESAAHAFSLGADAIQVATRFVTTEECDADIRYKEAHLKAKESDIAIVKSPVGMPGRAIMNPFMQHVMAGEKIPHSPCHRCLAKCSPGEIPYCITDKLIAAVKGDVENGLLFCGAKAYMADKIETVHDVIADLFGTESECIRLS